MAQLQPPRPGREPSWIKIYTRARGRFSAVVRVILSDVLPWLTRTSTAPGVASAKFRDQIAECERCSNGDVGASSDVLRPRLEEVAWCLRSRVDSCRGPLCRRRCSFGHAINGAFDGVACGCYRFGRPFRYAPFLAPAPVPRRIGIRLIGLLHDDLSCDVETPPEQCGVRLCNRAEPVTPGTGLAPYMILRNDEASASANGIVKTKRFYNDRRDTEPCVVRPLTRISRHKAGRDRRPRHATHGLSCAVPGGCAVDPRACCDAGTRSASP